MNAEQTGIVVAPPSIPDGLSPLYQRTLELALAEVGAHEEPPHSNRGPRVDQYLIGVDGRGGWLITDLSDSDRKWCARFAVWGTDRAVADLSLLETTVDPFQGGSRGGGLASGAKLVRTARALELIRSGPAPGRIGVIVHANGGSHVVRCVLVEPGGATMITIEGNHRDQVECVRRAVGEVSFWIECG